MGDVLGPENSWSLTVFFAKINNFFSGSNHSILISAIDSECSYCSDMM